MATNLFLEKIKSYGAAVCLYEDEQSWSFDTFLHEIEKAKTGLRKLTAQEHPLFIALEAHPSPDYFIKLFAITEAGHTVAPYIHPSEIESLEPNIIINTSGTQHIHSKIHPHAIPGGIVLQTSGVTGKPKVVLHRFHQIAEKYMNLRHPFKSIFIFSPEHISGIETTLSILAPGGCMYFPADRSPDTVTRAIREEGIDLMSCTPTFLSLILMQQETIPSSLKYINFGAERMSEGLLRDLKKSWPLVEFRQAFGTTETTNIRTWSDADSLHFKPGVKEVDYKIENGKLYIKTPESFVKIISGPAVVTDGWYETGDFVQENESGYLEITSRNNALIQVGGEKIAPAEVEKIIGSVSGVWQVKVYGQPHILTGQMLCAEVLGEPGKDRSELKAAIRKACRSALPDYKIPQKIIMIKQPTFNRRMKRL